MCDWIDNALALRDGAPRQADLRLSPPALPHRSQRAPGQASRSDRVMRGPAVALLEALFLRRWLLRGCWPSRWLRCGSRTLCRCSLPKRLPPDEPVRSRAVSVVIPTWNGKHHLEANLASVVEALAANPDNEVIVVENASEDGSAEWLREHFPQVRVLALERISASAVARTRASRRRRTTSSSCSTTTCASIRGSWRLC
jgi:hypothetical protein